MTGTQRPRGSEDQVTAGAEAEAAQLAYRRRVRAASIAIIFGSAAALAVSAVLPTTTVADRAGLVFSATAVLIAGALWFALVPKRAFGPKRILVGAMIAQGLMLTMLGLTGGASSIYFPYYLLPVLVLILSGIWRHAATLGALAAAGIVGLALSTPSTDLTRDISVVRLFQIATFTFVSVATAVATGETRRALAARSAALAAQRADAFQMAITDELTGLYNRHYMRDELRRMTARATRRDRPFAILSLDVDGLKRVNDSRGHQAGDALLRGIADAMHAVLRSEDIAVRMGGDEFVVLLPDADRGEAVAVAYRIRQRIAAQAEQPGAAVSTGIGVWHRGDDPEETLRQADQELYRAKAGRTAARPS